MLIIKEQEDETMAETQDKMGQPQIRNAFKAKEKKLRIIYVTFVISDMVVNALL